MISVANAEGDGVAIVQSVFAPFGGLVADAETGFVLNNRLMGFSTKPGDLNGPAPGKRPAHTLNPAMAFKDDRLALVPEKALRYEDIRGVNDLSARERDELERFFLTAVAFQNKNLKILGWGGPQAAATLVRDSQTRKRKGRKKR